MSHECIIGLLWHYDTSNLATVTMVKEHIADTVRYNTYLKDKGVAASWRCYTEYTLRDYADKRKNTDLTRFDFCPECGKKIDWKAIREEEPT